LGGTRLVRLDLPLEEQAGMDAKRRFRLLAFERASYQKRKNQKQEIR